MVVHEADISVCMPVYNGMPFLRDSVESVLSQKDMNLELVLSIDPSVDGSEEFIYSLRDPRLKIVRNKNPGLFQNLNNSIRNASASFIHIFAQDDIMLDTFLRDQLETFRQNPDICLLIANPRDVLDPKLRIPGKHDLLWRLVHYASVSDNISCLSFPKDLIERIGAFDEKFRFAGDVEFYFRVLDVGPVAYLDTPQLFIRAHEGQTSRSLSARLGYVLEERRLLADYVRPSLSEYHFRKVFAFRGRIRGGLHIRTAARLFLRGSPLAAVRLIQENVKTYGFLNPLMGALPQVFRNEPLVPKSEFSTYTRAAEASLLRLKSDR